MTRFLVSDENPEGFKLEDILTVIRADIIRRCDRITADTRPEALHVLANNVKVLDHLTQAINLAMDSSKTLDRSFGPSQARKGGAPRIGDL